MWNTCNNTNDDDHDDDDNVTYMPQICTSVSVSNKNVFHLFLKVISNASY